MIHPLIQTGADARLALAFDPSRPRNASMQVTGTFTVGGDTFSQQAWLLITPQEGYLGFPLSFDPALVLQAYDDIQDATRAAEAELEKLTVEIERQRAVVRAEREQARAKVDAAHRDVDASHATYLSKKAYYNGLIAAEYVVIGAEKVALGVATAALDAARAVLQVARAAVVSTPVDLDPRVAPIIAARGVALATLNALQNAMPEIPDVPGTIQATVGLRIDHGGVTSETRATYCENGSCIEIRNGTWDREAGRACVTLPPEGAQRICTMIPAEPG